MFLKVTTHHQPEVQATIAAAPHHQGFFFASIMSNLKAKNGSKKLLPFKRNAMGRKCPSHGNANLKISPSNNNNNNNNNTLSLDKGLK